MNIQLFDILTKIGQRTLPILGKQAFYSTILFLVILLLAKVLRRRSPYWHLGLWALLLIRLLLPPDISFPWSARNLLEALPLKTAWNTVAENTIQPSLLDSSIADFTQLTPERTMVRRESSQAVHSAATPEKNRFQWYSIGFFLWIVGLSGFSGRYLFHLFRYHGIIKQALPVQHPAVNRILQRCRAQFGIKRPVRLVSSARFSSPFTIGILRPSIFLPERLLDSGDMALVKTILAHELVHIKRFDNIWMLLQNLLQILYFFHPVVWYASHQLNLSRECICDQLVIATCKLSTRTYGENLLDALELNLIGSERMSVLPAFSNHKKNLKYRIRQLKGGNTVKSYQRIVVSLCVMIIGLFVLPMAAYRIQASNTSVEEVSKSVEELSFKTLVESSKANEFSVNRDTQEITFIGEAKTFSQNYVIQADQIRLKYGSTINDIVMISLDGPSTIELHDFISITGTDLMITPVSGDVLSETDIIRIRSSERILLIKGGTALTGYIVDYVVADGYFVVEGSDEENAKARDSIEGTAVSASRIQFFWETNNIEAEGNVSISSDLTGSNADQKRVVEFISPLREGRITARFGPMMHPIEKKEMFHQGIDIAAKIGTAVYAVADGTVISVEDGDPKGYGKNVILEHAGGYTSRYAKLSKLLVQEGQTVKAGEKIALSGNTGVSTGPHLHFELLKDGEHQDPETLIDFAGLE